MCHWLLLLDSIGYTVDSGIVAMGPIVIVVLCALVVVRLGWRLLGSFCRLLAVTIGSTGPMCAVRKSGRRRRPEGSALSRVFGPVEPSPSGRACGPGWSGGDCWGRPLCSCSPSSTMWCARCGRGGNGITLARRRGLARLGTAFRGASLVGRVRSVFVVGGGRQRFCGLSFSVTPLILWTA